MRSRLAGAAWPADCDHAQSPPAAVKGGEARGSSTIALNFQGGLGVHPTCTLSAWRSRRPTPSPCERDTHRAMSEESTTPDLVELQRRGYEAVNRRDFDTAVSIYAPDALWGIRELGVFEGLAAVRGVLEDWFAPD